MTSILALDQGTTSSRAISFGHDGRILHTAQREFRQLFPAPGWVEHDANEIWTTQRDMAAQVIAASAAHPVRAIGITNQRETTVIWERASGQPIANAIVWQDRRTATFCDELKTAGHGPLIKEKTGLVIDAYFSGSKVKWLLDHIPHARERAKAGELAFGTIDSWLIWNLTSGKVHVTDVSNASRTLLFNIHTLAWDEELLGLMEIPREILPRVVSSSGVIGETACSGLPAGIPIAGIAGDQQAALFGQACQQAGMAKNTYGTGCFMLMNTGNKPVVSKNNLLTTIAWQIGTHTEYALEGSVFVAGAAIQWLRDGLGIIAHSSEVEALAASVPDCGGVYLVPAFAGLGAPYWDQDARGLICGLTRGSTRAHIARAALESIAFQSADLCTAMTRDAEITLSELRVDGGAAANNLLMQFQADLLGVPVVRPEITETTALGAAYLAGLGVGFWSNQDEIAARWRKERTFTPTMPHTEARDHRLQWVEAVRRARTTC